jgi:hypothetical protein
VIDAFDDAAASLKAVVRNDAQSGIDELDHLNLARQHGGLRGREPVVIFCAQARFYNVAANRGCGRRSGYSRSGLPVLGAKCHKDDIPRQYSGVGNT